MSDDPKLMNTSEVVQLLRAALDARDAEIAQLREALRPFANAVYNENGDVTVTPCGIDEYYKAKRVYDRTALQGGDDEG